MAYATTDYYIRPEDGWVKVATNPAACMIRPTDFFPFRLAVTASGAPSSTPVAASGVLTFSGQPNNGGTVTIGTITYTFVTDFDDPGAYDVKIGTSQANSEAALTTAINGRPAVPAVPASGTITIAAGVPTAGDTVTVGDDVYTFVVAAAVPFDVELGTIEVTGQNLTLAINTDGTSGVTAADGTTGIVNLTADVAGFAGNEIVLLEGADNTTVTGAGTLTGGQDDAPAIVAHPLVVAADGSGTVTVTARGASESGNSIAFSENATNITAAGSGFLAGGLNALEGLHFGRGGDGMRETIVMPATMTGEVYLRIDRPPSSSPDHMHFGVITN